MPPYLIWIVILKGELPVNMVLLSQNEQLWCFRPLNHRTSRYDKKTLSGKIILKLEEKEGSEKKKKDWQCKNNHYQLLYGNIGKKNYLRSAHLFCHLWIQDWRPENLTVETTHAHSWAVNVNIGYCKSNHYELISTLLAIYSSLDSE